MARLNAAKGKLVPLLRPSKEGVWGIRARNKEQHYALDLLLNDDVKLVTLVGKAGTGKTLLAIAAGLQKTTEEGDLPEAAGLAGPSSRSAATSATCPGDIEEKLNPWMQPIFDNVEFLMDLSRADKKAGPRLPRADRPRAFIEIEPLTYIRGREHPQPVHHRRRGAEPHAARGEDHHHPRRRRTRRSSSPATPTRSTTPTSTATNNGLVHVVNRFKEERIAGHITLTKGERSALAELAANLL